MKTAYIHGQVYTGTLPLKQAFLVEDGTFLWVGGEEEARLLEAEERVDLGGAFVCAGFNDSHMHLYGVGTNIMSVQMLGSKSPEDVIERGRKFIEANNVPEGTYVTGRGWNQDYFSDAKRMPNRWDLDQVSTTCPVVAVRACENVDIVLVIDEFVFQSADCLHFREMFVLLGHSVLSWCVKFNCSVSVFVFGNHFFASVKFHTLIIKDKLFFVKFLQG